MDRYFPRTCETFVRRKMDTSSLRRFFPFSNAKREGKNPRDLLFPPFVEGRVDERESERDGRVAAWAKRGTDTQQMVSLEGRNPISRTVQREARL